MVEKIFEEHRHITKKTNRPVKHHRHEILDVFAFLESKGLIKKINTDPGPGLVYERGRPKTYYTMTKSGLRTLIDGQNLTALQFWKILFGYVLNYEDSLTTDEVEAFYQMFMGKEAKYHNRVFPFQLHDFHHMCSEFEKTIFQSDKITTSQKVIEVLSIYAKIPLEKLVKETGESEFEVRQVLTKYSSNRLFDRYSPREFAGLLTHNIITVPQNDAGEQIYELSLFGLMLSLTLLLRYHYMGTLKYGLYFKDFSLEHYYDKVASAYEEKLPLIFKKWKELKKVLKISAAYNFYKVLDKQNGGQKTELCEGIRTIMIYNGKLMWDFGGSFAAAATEVLPALADSSDITGKRNIMQKTFTLYAKYEEVMRLNCPKSTYFNDTRPVNPEIHNNATIIRKMEQTFAEEITALYYMNLVSEGRIIVGKSENRLRWSRRTAQHCLSVILKNDFSLSVWFSKWMKDLVTLQNETLQNTKSKIRQLDIENMVSAL